jgi:uncharacterized protein (TIGR02452 family)
MTANVDPLQESLTAFVDSLTLAGLPPDDEVCQSFSLAARGEQDLDAFRTKVSQKVATVASYALKYPQVGSFFRCLKGNPHMQEDRKGVIAEVVDGVLAHIEDGSFVEQTVVDQVRQGLQTRSLGAGWDLNIKWAASALAMAMKGRLVDPIPAQRLVEIFFETCQASASGEYSLPTGPIVSIDPATVQEMQENTRVYQDCPEIDGSWVGRYTTAVSVVDDDSLSAAYRIVERGGRPFVLNLANAFTPGGGVQEGCRAQEEDLFRSTNCFEALYPERNPTLQAQLKGDYEIPETGAIFTPRVMVMRDSPRGYAWRERPFEVAMLASAAYNQRAGHRGGAKGTEYSTAQCGVEEGTRKKIQTQLAVAAKEGYTRLVLGAFGCGAFENDRRLVSGIYRELLEGEFFGVFEEVVFAVLGGVWPRTENFEVFKATFANPLQRAPVRDLHETVS